MKAPFVLSLALLVAVPACVTGEADEPEPFFGEVFHALHRPAWQVYCPSFDNIHPTPSDAMVIERDSVSFGGKAAYDVKVGPLDEWGISQVTFTIDRMWALGDRPVPVSIKFEGSAMHDFLSFDGVVRFPTDQLELKNCAMSMYLTGSLETAPPREL